MTCGQPKTREERIKQTERWLNATHKPTADDPPIDRSAEDYLEYSLIAEEVEKIQQAILQGISVAINLPTLEFAQAVADELSEYEFYRVDFGQWQGQVVRQ